MSKTTQQMAEEMYQRMCEYVGANHEQECVKFIKFTLDSMEVRLEQQAKSIDELAEALDDVMKNIHFDQGYNQETTFEGGWGVYDAAKAALTKYKTNKQDK